MVSSYGHRVFTPAHEDPIDDPMANRLSDPHLTLEYAFLQPAIASPYHRVKRRVNSET
ncbi:MAG: hypothetical protein ACRC9V_11290 [Aeromonas sp.]